MGEPRSEGMVKRWRHSNGYAWFYEMDQVENVGDLKDLAQVVLDGHGDYHATIYKKDGPPHEQLGPFRALRAAQEAVEQRVEQVAFKPR